MKKGTNVNNDEADPIDDSLKERIKAGGVTQVVDKKNAPGGAKATIKPAGNDKTAGTGTVKANKEEKKTADTAPKTTDKLPVTNTADKSAKDKD